MTADLEARAHHLVAIGLALLAVDADRHGARKVAAMSRNVGIGIASATRGRRSRRRRAGKVLPMLAMTPDTAQHVVQ
jgi:hypothetical protein